MALDKVLMPVLDGHPDVFDTQWPLRVGDVDRTGRLRLDAAARQIQDVGQDHMHALGFDETHILGPGSTTVASTVEPEPRRTVERCLPPGLLLNGEAHTLDT